jgi:DsbC/DsbD-like thiol-disulfide interchange protein
LSALLALAILPCTGQENLPKAKDVVSPSAYVSLDPVPRGRAFDLAVVMKIRPGFHVNAREVSEDYLIPTDLNADLPPGFRLAATHYPKGTQRQMSFSKTPLNVYEGSVTLLMKLRALQSAPLGPQTFTLNLHYQACSEHACLPPVTLPVEAKFEVAPAGAAARRAHPEVFGGQSHAQ